MLRVLAFDRALPDRAHGSVDLLVLAKTSERALVLSKALDAAHHTVHGLPVTADTHAWVDSATFAAAVAASGCDAVVLVGDLDGKSLNDALAVTRAEKIGSVSTSLSDVVNGASVGVVIENNRPALKVNLDAAAAEGLDLDAGMLRLAEIVSQ